jgi:hypothetical protein
LSRRHWKFVHKALLLGTIDRKRESFSESFLSMLIPIRDLQAWTLAKLLWNRSHR